MKISIENYGEAIKEIGIENVPEEWREFADALREDTDSYSDWSEYHNVPDIKEMADLYFKELEKLFKGKEPKEPEGRINSLRKKNKEKEHFKDKTEAKDSKSKPKAHSFSKDDKYFIGQHVVLIATGEEAIINKIFTIKTGHLIPGKGATEPEVEYSFMVKTKDAIKPVNEEEIKIVPKPKTGAKPKHEEPKSEVNDTKFVENIAEDVKFIKSFVGLHNKEKSFSSIRGLLNRLQKAIVQKIIRKESPFASEIKTVQDKLVRLVNSLRENQSVKVIIDKSLLNKLVLIAGGEKVYTSIGYIKRYIGMQGKQIEREKALAFVGQMEKAIKNGKLASEDPYLDKVKAIVKSLNSYLIGKETVVTISKAELNGLMGIVEGCGCGLSGMENAPTTTDKTETVPTSSGIMNSMDFLKLNFEGLGFVGKWYELIGNPAKGFSAMVFGKPKFGKSYLCIDWAGYVSINHGKTLYVAQEEALDKTLKMKVEERGVANPNLDLSDHLPDDLSKYSFVFIDSVTKLGLTPDDLTKLEKKYPATSFIYIFQVRKDGAFRGRNDFQHNVDIVIEVPQKGLAVQYGRYNQGGEMQIFDEDEFNEVAY